MPAPLDEFPIHQSPLSLAHVASTDRNFYDRWYFNGHDRTGKIFLIAGMGFYPHLGVKDGYVCLRHGDRQTVVRFSDAYDPATDDRLAPAVGPMRIEPVEPLHRVRLLADAAEHGVRLDLTWEGSFPAVDETPHLLRTGTRPIISTWRFAQVGTWSGSLRIGDDTLPVDPDTWVGTRDRSWGIRPVGDAEPAGRPVTDPGWGFWWLYVPLRFDDFAVVLIAQEDGEGHRSLNDAVRVHPDGRVVQLGWPRAHIRYQPGTRIPTGAQIALTEPDGRPLTLEIETLGYVPLHVGCGYGGDTEWLHGQWKGTGWVESATYDMTDPQVLGRVPWGVVDHVARAGLDGRVGWGLFEHGTIGRHAPSGFAGIESVAP